MESRYLNLDCSVAAAMQVISGKWKIWILVSLMQGPKRFSELMRLMPGVTQRMLTAQLRELEADQVVTRVVYAVVPPKVEYSLSDMGKTLVPVLQQLEQWGADYIKYRLAQDHSA